jgi:molybdopterin-guanine dinucleotide biosynthesis protein A
VVACDVPLVERGVLELLVRRLEGSTADAVVPRAWGVLQPLEAAYSSRCMPFLERRIQRGQLKMVDFFPEVQVDCVPMDEIYAAGGSLWSFFNVNTPADFALAERYLRGEVRGDPPPPRRKGPAEAV